LLFSSFVIPESKLLPTGLLTVTEDVNVNGKHRERVNMMCDGNEAAATRIAD
jgi:hypothetical protein